MNKEIKVITDVNEARAEVRKFFDFLKLDNTISYFKIRSSIMQLFNYSPLEWSFVKSATIYDGGCITCNRSEIGAIRLDWFKSSVYIQHNNQMIQMLFDELLFKCLICIANASPDLNLFDRLKFIYGGIFSNICGSDVINIISYIDSNVANNTFTNNTEVALHAIRLLENPNYNIAEEVLNAVLCGRLYAENYVAIDSIIKMSYTKIELVSDNHISEYIIPKKKSIFAKIPNKFDSYLPVSNQEQEKINQMTCKHITPSGEDMMYDIGAGNVKCHMCGKVINKELWVRYKDAYNSCQRSKEIYSDLLIANQKQSDTRQKLDAKEEAFEKMYKEPSTKINKCSKDIKDINIKLENSIYAQTAPERKSLITKKAANNISRHIYSAAEKETKNANLECHALDDNMKDIRNPVFPFMVMGREGLLISFPKPVDKSTLDNIINSDIPEYVSKDKPCESEGLERELFNEEMEEVFKKMDSLYTVQKISESNDINQCTHSDGGRLTVYKINGMYHCDKCGLISLSLDTFTTKEE